MHDLMLKFAIMLLSPPKYLFSIEIEIYPTVLVCFTWQLDHVIYVQLKKQLLLLQVEQIHKITTFFTQNDFCEFYQLVTTVIFFSA